LLITGKLVKFDPRRFWNLNIILNIPSKAEWR
jgi:hypothetical protein